MPIDSFLFKKMHNAEVGKQAPTPKPAESVKAEKPSLGDLSDKINEIEAVDDSDSKMDDVAPSTALVPVDAIPSTDNSVDAVDDQGLVVVEAPATFKDRLDLLDSIVQSELGISAFTVDAIRGHVKVIMMDLTTQPELEAILIDRDVHNILRFIRHVKNDAAAARVEVKAKRETKAKKAKGGLSGFSFEGLSLPGMAEAKPQLPATLEDLGRMKT